MYDNENDVNNTNNGNSANQNTGVGSENTPGYQNNDYQNTNGSDQTNQNWNGYSYNSGMNGSPDPKKPKKDNWKKVVGGVALAAGLLVVGGTGFYCVNAVSDALNGFGDKKSVEETKKPDGTQDTTKEDATLDTTETFTTGTDSVARVVENVMPSIVSITTKSKETVSDFFGRTYLEDKQGSGSGIIIGQNSNEVLVVTNNHVITGNDATVKISFFDGKTLDATVKGADPSADLAVVSVKFADIADQTKKKIKVISVGDSDKTKVGEVAIAIGNALGIGQSVTVGHISALNREIAVEDSSMTLMQTDAAINRGNSGGALLNAQGQLIGINSAKTATTGVEGMGYAIPISNAQPIIQDLMNGKNASVKRGAYLGIVGQDITDSNASRFDIPKGVYITEVAEGSPAEQAGIRSGMVIVGLDGKEIKNKQNLMQVIDSLNAGDMVTINVAVRQDDGKYETKEMTVTMGKKKETENQNRDSQNNGNGGDYSEQDPYGNTNPFGGNGADEDPFSWFGN